MTRRKVWVLAAQVAVFIIVFGGWQLFTSLKIVDPFFFGQPSGVVSKLADWAKHGTGFGSLWQQIWVTMEEAILGFLIGTAGGILAGVLLGQVRFLSDVLSPYIKALNALPRIVLGALFVVIFVTHDLEEAIALADQVVVMTAAPGTVKAVFDIDLPRPRGAVQEIRFGKRFGELHQQIWESLRDEVERAYARTAGVPAAPVTPEGVLS